MGAVHDGSPLPLCGQRAPSLTGALPLSPYRVHGTGHNKHRMRPYLPETPLSIIILHAKIRNNSIYLCLLKDTLCGDIVVGEGRDKMPHDALDRIVEEWLQVRPDLDPSPLAVLGRL